MDNIEAAYTLIVAEADRRIKKGGDYCGKLVEVAQEVDAKIIQLMKVSREEERKNATSQKD